MRPLAVHFPADSGVWLKLGDARFAANKDSPALDAYQHALKADPDNSDAQALVALVEETLQLDPTPRGLSVRERGNRWNEVLGRVVAGAGACSGSAEIDKGKALLKKHDASVETVDQKMQTAVKVWKQMSPSCKNDAVLVHVMAKLAD